MLTNDPLDSIKVAAPCTADWEQMKGSDEERFCGQCHLHVYNISSMTRAEALRIIQNREDRLCIKFYRRRDGTIMTSNCPKGLRAVKRRIVKLPAALLAAILSAPGWLTNASASSSLHESNARQTAQKSCRRNKARRIKSRRRYFSSTTGALSTRMIPADSPVMLPPLDTIPIPSLVDDDMPPPLLRKGIN
jgi:hypothetical protein